MSGQLVAVIVTLNDPINTATQTFNIKVAKLPKIKKKIVKGKKK
jgi:hypothetical protein